MVGQSFFFLDVDICSPPKRKFAGHVFFLIAAFFLVLQMLAKGGPLFFFSPSSWILSGGVLQSVQRDSEAVPLILLGRRKSPRRLPLFFGSPSPSPLAGSSVVLLGSVKDLAVVTELSPYFLEVVPELPVLPSGPAKGCFSFVTERFLVAVNGLVLLIMFFLFPSSMWVIQCPPFFRIPCVNKLVPLAGGAPFTSLRFFKGPSSTNLNAKEFFPPPPPFFHRTTVRFGSPPTLTSPIFGYFQAFPFLSEFR